MSAGFGNSVLLQQNSSGVCFAMFKHVGESEAAISFLARVASSYLGLHRIDRQCVLCERHPPSARNHLPDRVPDLWEHRECERLSKRHCELGEAQYSLPTRVANSGIVVATVEEVQGGAWDLNAQIVCSEPLSQLLLTHRPPCSYYCDSMPEHILRRPLFICNCIMSLGLRLSRSPGLTSEQTPLWRRLFWPCL